MPDKDVIMETLNVSDLSTTTIRGRFTDIGVL
jgi:hypothetical protein